MLIVYLEKDPGSLAGMTARVITVCNSPYSKVLQQNSKELHSKEQQQRLYVHPYLDAYEPLLMRGGMTCSQNYGYGKGTIKKVTASNSLPWCHCASTRGAAQSIQRKDWKLILTFLRSLNCAQSEGGGLCMTLNLTIGKAALKYDHYHLPTTISHLFCPTS